MVAVMEQFVSKVKGLYTQREWQYAGLVFVLYLFTYLVSSYVLPPETHVNPASALALAILYFGGIRLWPIVFIAALLGRVSVGAPLLAILVVPCIEALQATAGTWLLHKTQIDPLFRRYRDTFYFLATVVGISVIGSTLELGIHLLQGSPDALHVWWYTYVAMLFSFLIITPFLLRWCTKPRFSRTPLEIVETLSVFILLVGIDYALFIQNVGTIGGIPLVYFMLVPLFWISLKLRPRFMTLALLVTSTFAVAGVLMHTDSSMLVEELYQIEVLIILLASIFFIVTSLEEDRRVNTNIMHSQMAALRNAVAKESSESKAKNDFIAILSHELRNPLAPVLSSIDLLKLKGPRDEEDAELLNLMEDRMGIVRRLLDDLLDISRISEGKITLKKEKTSLESILKRAIVSTEHHRKELHQRLVTRFPQKQLHLHADGVRLEQVFSNLLTNASKFSSSGDTITLTMRDHDGAAEIEIADRGIGIDPGELEAIFLPFRQIQDSDRSKKGLGIGLALVRTFVEMHDGTIQAHSEGQGRGSRFVVYLPLAAGTTEAKVPRKEWFDTTTHQSTNPLVLIIDDNDAAAGGIGRLLEFQGYRVAYAYDGNQGVAKAQNLSPQAIFLDIGLPDQDGWSVAKKLRSKGFTGRLIALTGYGVESSKARNSNVRFDHYLVKPVGLADLQRVLAGLI